MKGFGLNKVSAKTHTPHTAVRELEKQFAGVQAIVELKEHPAFDYVSRIMIQQVRSLEKSIISLSQKPETNKDSLISKTAERKALIGLLGLVDGLYNNKEVMYEKLEDLYEKFMNLIEQENLADGTTSRK